MLGQGAVDGVRPGRGIIAVLDNRVLTKRYGQRFINALPQMDLEIV